MKKSLFYVVLFSVVGSSLFAIEIRREIRTENRERVLVIFYDRESDTKIKRSIFGDRSPYRLVVDEYSSGNINWYLKSEYNDVVFTDKDYSFMSYRKQVVFFDERQPDGVTRQETSEDNVGNKVVSTEYKEGVSVDYYKNIIAFDSKGKLSSEQRFFGSGRTSENFRQRYFFYNEGEVVRILDSFYDVNNKYLDSVDAIYTPPDYSHSLQKPAKITYLYKNHPKGALKSTVFNLNGLGYVKTTDYDSKINQNSLSRLDSVVNGEGTVFLTDAYYDKEIKPGYFTERYSLKSDGTYETLYFKKGEVPTPKIEFPKD